MSRETSKTHLHKDRELGIVESGADQRKLCQLQTVYRSSCPRPTQGEGGGGGDTTETISKYLVMTGTLFEVSGGNSNDNNRKKTRGFRGRSPQCTCQTPLLRSCGVTRERERKRGSRERDSEEREGEERERESSVSLSSLSSLSLSLSLLSLTSKQAACMFGCVIFLCIVMRTFGFALYSSCSLLLLSSFPATLQLEKRRQNGSRCCCHCCCWCCS
jgi:hypothetical protein